MAAKLAFAIGLVLLSLVTAACGGGGGGSSPVPSSPGVTSTTPPAVAGTSVSTPGAVVAATGVSGITSSITIAGSGTVNATETSTAPTGLASLSAAARKTSDALKSTQATTNTPLVYITITAATATTITGLPTSSFTFSTAPSAAPYLAYFSGSSWVTLTGPATLSGGTATFAAGTFSPAITLQANQSLFLAVYLGGPLSATPAPNPSPSATATATATASPAPVVSGTPFPTGTTGPVSIVTDFFTNIIPNASNIRISAWDLSSDIDSALETAAAKGATVVVITPYSENSSNSSDIQAILNSGPNTSAIYEYTSSHGTATSNISYDASPMDIHAKFAVVDGAVYMDGHNWFTTDVVSKDTDPSDMAAVIADLNGSFATPAPSGDSLTLFTTDKQVSLHNESNFLQNVALPAITDGAADEFDFITESFNPNNASGNYNDDVYIGVCQIASATRQPALHMVFEQESGYSTAAKTAIQNLILWNPASASTIRSNNNGHEKISMIRKSGVPLAAWYGSSNSTTTDLFDWGMVTYDPAVLTALAQYFDTVEYSNAQAVTAGSGSPTACGTVHS